MFSVRWEIDIEASSAREAAEKAWEHMRRDGSIANVFDVSDGSSVVRVDLSEEEN